MMRSYRGSKWSVLMGMAKFGQRSAALIAGLLVLLLGAGLFRLLWVYIDAPFAIVALLAWLVLPVLPFALRLLSLRDAAGKRGVDGIC